MGVSVSSTSALRRAFSLIASFSAGLAKGIAMTTPDLRHLAPPPLGRAAANAAVRLVVGGTGLFMLSRFWVLGADIAWWLGAAWLAGLLAVSVGVAAWMSAGAKSPHEKAIAAERLAVARFPFWPVMVAAKLVAWALIGQLLGVGI